MFLLLLYSSGLGYMRIFTLVSFFFYLILLRVIFKPAQTRVDIDLLVMTANDELIKY